MSYFRVGDRVEILGGMPEFVGCLGEISDDRDRDGRTVMYRVELDETVVIPMTSGEVLEVDDDLWAAEYLRRLPASEQHSDARAEFASLLAGGRGGGANGSS